MPQLYQWTDIAIQNGKNGRPMWVVVKGSVYDVTKFLAEHPGGADLIAEYAGKDATKAFNSAGHSSTACKDMEQYKIGELEKAVDINNINIKQKDETQINTVPNQGYRIFCCF